MIPNILKPALRKIVNAQPARKLNLEGLSLDKIIQSLKGTNKGVIEDIYNTRKDVYGNLPMRVVGPRRLVNPSKVKIKAKI